MLLLPLVLPLLAQHPPRVIAINAQDLMDLQLQRGSSLIERDMRDDRRESGAEKRDVS